jgi:hypothetical protein
LLDKIFKKEKMTVSIRVESKTGLAIGTCSGVLSKDDAINGAKSLWQTPGWPGKAAVWDFRKAKFNLSSSDIELVALFIVNNQPAIPPSKMAFVAQSDLEYGLSRIFEAYRKDQRTDFRVFRDFEQAVIWASDT